MSPARCECGTHRSLMQHIQDRIYNSISPSSTSLSPSYLIKYHTQLLILVGLGSPDGQSIWHDYSAIDETSVACYCFKRIVEEPITPCNWRILL